MSAMTDIDKSRVMSPLLNCFGPFGKAYVTNDIQFIVKLVNANWLSTGMQCKFILLLFKNVFLLVGLQVFKLSVC